MLRLITHDSTVRFDHCEKPEFDNWRWVDFWEPLNDVVYFKRKVYQKAMAELGAILAIDSVPVNAAGFLSKEVKRHQEKETKSR
jgi:putative (di)nucleoside polyphosphate hydrolase